MTHKEFREAFHGHKDVLYRFAYRMTGSSSASEDVVQECFLVLWRKPNAYDPDRGVLRSFLFGVVRNLVLKRLRDERPYDELEPESFVCPPIDLVGIRRGEAVARAVQMLPALQREAIVLAEYEEMSLDEIARATGAEIAAVKSRLHRGRENLRRMLAPFLESRGTVYETKR